MDSRIPQLTDLQLNFYSSICLSIMKSVLNIEKDGVLAHPMPETPREAGVNPFICCHLGAPFALLLCCHSFSTGSLWQTIPCAPHHFLLIHTAKLHFPASFADGLI